MVANLATAMITTKLENNDNNSLSSSKNILIKLLIIIIIIGAYNSVHSDTDRE
jgi:hypothetical protein